MMEDRILEIEERVLCYSSVYWKEHQELIKTTLRLLYKFIKQCYREGCYNHNAENIVRDFPECPAKSLFVTYVYQMECHSYAVQEDIDFIKRIFDRRILAASGNEAEQFCYILLKDCIFSSVNIHLGWTVYHAEHGNRDGYYEKPKETIVEGIINYLTGFFNYEDGLEVQKYLLEVRCQEEKEDCSDLAEVLKESLEQIEQSKKYIERRKKELLDFKKKIPLNIPQDRISVFKGLSNKIRHMRDFELMDMACSCSNEAYASLCIAVDGEAFWRLMDIMTMKLRDILFTTAIPEVYEKCMEAPDAIENILLTEIQLIPKLKKLIEQQWFSISDMDDMKEGGTV